MRRHTGIDYSDQLRQLMPQGLAWDKAPDGPFARLLNGMGDELARIEGRAVYLALYEFYAQTTRELLPDWELEYGLPDYCRTLGETLDERIADLLQKIRTLGGQSKAYYIGLAKALGIDITITEFRPFRAGLSRAGDRLYDRKWIHVFLVNGPPIKIYKFRAGRNASGDRLRYWRGNEVLECIINRLKPAHTYAMFGYQDEEYPDDQFVSINAMGDVQFNQTVPDDAQDPIFALDEDGDVVIRQILMPDDENVGFIVDQPGDIMVRKDEEF